MFELGLDTHSHIENEIKLGGWQGHLYQWRFCDGVSQTAVGSVAVVELALLCITVYSSGLV